MVANPWKVRETTREALGDIPFYTLRYVFALAADGARSWSLCCFDLTWYNCVCCIAPHDSLFFIVALPSQF